MEPPPRPNLSSTSLFQVYLRLRPHGSTAAAAAAAAPSIYPTLPSPERFLTVEPAENEHQDAPPTHITIRPPSDSRKRAVEKFAFTKVFEEPTSQLEVFDGAGAVPIVEGVLNEGRDGLIATLGVTGSGKVGAQGRQRMALTLPRLTRYWDPSLNEVLRSSPLTYSTVHSIPGSYKVATRARSYPHYW